MICLNSQLVKIGRLKMIFKEMMHFHYIHVVYDSYDHALAQEPDMSC